MTSIHQCLRNSRFNFIVVILAAWLSPSALADNGQLRIELESGLLTLEADEVPLAEIIRALGQQAGFEVMLNGDFDTPVTITLTQKPLSEALQRLLVDVGRMIVYAPPQPQQTERQIQRLWLFEPKPESDSTIAVPEPEPETATVDTGNALEPLWHDDPTIRSEAALKLRQSGEVAAAVATLQQILQENADESARTRAVIALGSLQNVQALAVLESALDDESLSVRVQALQSLGQIKHEHATEILGDVLLSDSDSRLRVIAAQGLGRHGSSLAQSLLEAVQNDSDSQVREAAIKAAADGSTETETQSETENN